MMKVTNIFLAVLEMLVSTNIAMLFSNDVSIQVGFIRRRDSTGTGNWVR